MIFLHMSENSFMSFFEKVTTIISAKKSVYHTMFKWSTPVVVRMKNQNVYESWDWTQW